MKNFEIDRFAEPALEDMDVLTDPEPIDEIEVVVTCEGETYAERFTWEQFDNGELEEWFDFEEWDGLPLEVTAYQVWSDGEAEGEIDLQKLLGVTA